MIASQQCHVKLKQTAGRWQSPNMPGQYARELIARWEGPLRKYRLPEAGRRASTFPCGPGAHWAAPVG